MEGIFAGATLGLVEHLAEVGVRGVAGHGYTVAISSAGAAAGFCRAVTGISTHIRLESGHHLLGFLQLAAYLGAVTLYEHTKHGGNAYTGKSAQNGNYNEKLDKGETFSFLCSTDFHENLRSVDISPIPRKADECKLKCPF